MIWYLMFMLSIELVRGQGHPSDLIHGVLNIHFRRCPPGVSPYIVYLIIILLYIVLCRILGNWTTSTKVATYLGVGYTSFRAAYFDHRFHPGHTFIIYANLVTIMLDTVLEAKTYWCEIQGIRH